MSHSASPSEGVTTPPLIAMIRDGSGRGVRVDRIDGWEIAHYGKTRVHLAGGAIVDLGIPPSEFVQRLDRALTAIATGDFGEST